MDTDDDRCWEGPSGSSQRKSYLQIWSNYSLFGQWLFPGSRKYFWKYMQLPNMAFKHDQ